MDRGGYTMTDIQHKHIIQQLNKWAPASLAYDWDPIGLQIGSIHDKTKNVLVTLDVFEEVVDEAIEHEANLIIAHHPLLFKPLQSIDFSTPKGKIVRKLIQHDITVYAMHTNLDITDDGVNDMLSEKLQLTNVKPFVPFSEEKLYKLVVFVPTNYVDDVRNALSEAGAGHIGNYSHCTFQTEGQGTFKPLEGTKPFIGEQGTLEFVDEYKLETIVPEKVLATVLQAMEDSHPYEEVAYDLYPLAQGGKQYGLGRIGKIKSEMTLRQFVKIVKDAFQLQGLRVIGKLDDTILRIAVVGGSGEKFIEQAKKANVDLYITGDLTFHQAQEAEQMGLNVIDAGHYIEHVMVDGVANYLRKHFPQMTTVASKVNTDPFQYF